MGKRLRSFDFGEQTRARYPWADWTDGSVWKITQGTDFTVALESMQTQLYLRGKAEDRSCRTRFQHDPEGIIFQFGPPGSYDPTGNRQPAKAPAKKRPAARKRR
jgi:hypothetical protein